MAKTKKKKAGRPYKGCHEVIVIRLDKATDAKLRKAAETSSITEVVRDAINLWLDTPWPERA